MVKSKSATIAFIVIILAIAGAIIYFRNSGAAIKDTATEEEAKWIGEHAVMYSQTNCIHCKEQLSLFGGNAKYLSIIDEKDLQKFIDAGITATPTWVINGEKYVGVQSIEKLKELTGYKA